jgi:hypothetical protein
MSLIKCTKKHTNSISPDQGTYLALQDVKKLDYGDVVYLKADCGHFLKVRINGKTKIWKRNSNKVRIPYKYGLYENGYITENDTVLVPK